MEYTFKPNQYEILCTGRVISTREMINIIPGFGRGEWLNNYYGPARNSSVPVKEHIRRKIMDMLESMHNTPRNPQGGILGNRTIGWFNRISSVTVTPDNDPGVRGEYRFTVWGDKYDV